MASKILKEVTFSRYLESGREREEREKGLARLLI